MEGCNACQRMKNRTEAPAKTLMMNKVLEKAWTYLTVVRRGSHRGGSPQNGLGYERTCGTTLASAYVLRRLSAAWSQLQMKERSPSGSEC